MAGYLQRKGISRKQMQATLERAMKELGMNQVELAGVFQVEQSSVTGYLSKSNDPKKQRSPKRRNVDLYNRFVYEAGATNLILGKYLPVSSPVGQYRIADKLDGELHQLLEIILRGGREDQIETAARLLRAIAGDVKRATTGSPARETAPVSIAKAQRRKKA